MLIHRSIQLNVLFFTFVFFAILSPAALAAEESIVVTTYYPSPYGVYGEMRLYPKSSPNPPCQEGTMYYDSDAGEKGLKVCDASGTPQSLGGFWAASPFNSNNIYNTNSGNVGIGTQDTLGLRLYLNANVPTPAGRNGMQISTPLGHYVGLGGGIGTDGSNTAGLHIGNQAGLNYGGEGGTLYYDYDATDRNLIAASTGGIRIAALGQNPPAGRDIVFATNPSNIERMRITDGGNVGIGTTNPDAKLDIYRIDRGPTTMGHVRFGGNNNWDSDMSFDGASDGIFVLTNTGIASGGTAFYSSATSLTPLVIQNMGNVGIGTTGPWANLHVRGNMNVEPTTTGNWQGLNAYNPNVGFWSHFPWGGDGWNYLSGNGTIFRHPSYGNTAWIRYDGSAHFSGRIGTQGYSPDDTKGLGGGIHTWDVIAQGGLYVFQDNTMRVLFQNSGGGWMQATLDVQDVWLRNANRWASSFSDIRLKKNIKPLTNVLNGLQNIHGVSFDWNELYDSLGHSNDKKQIGVIAQELEAQFPELVTAASNESYKSINYDGLTAVLIEAVNELKMQNDSARKRIQAMEAKIADLEKRRRIP